MIRKFVLSLIITGWIRALYRKLQEHASRKGAQRPEIKSLELTMAQEYVAAPEAVFEVSEPGRTD